MKSDEKEERAEVMCECGKLASFRDNSAAVFGAEEFVWIKQHDSFIASGWQIYQRLNLRQEVDAMPGGVGEGALVGA